MTATAPQLVTTEVYFGWDAPHEVPMGEHIEVSFIVP